MKSHSFCKLFFYEREDFLSWGVLHFWLDPVVSIFLKRFLRRWSVELMKWFCTQKSKTRESDFTEKSYMFFV